MDNPPSPEDAWEQLLREFQPYAARTGDLRAVLDSLSPTGAAAGALDDRSRLADAELPTGLAGETDPLRLFLGAESPEEQSPSVAMTPALQGDHEQAMLAALEACFATLLPAAEPQTRWRSGGWTRRCWRWLARRKDEAARYRLAAQSLADGVEPLFRQVFLAVYRREMAQTTGRSSP